MLARLALAAALALPAGATHAADAPEALHARHGWQPQRPAPSLEIVLPLDAAGPGPCADQSRHPSRARIAGRDRLELATGRAIPPADLGC
jgi:hypothetical protein